MKTFRGPSAPKPAESTTPADAPIILYVEDNDANWDVTLLRLKNRFQLHRARNAEEACRLVTELGPRLAAILMDIQLQGSELDGIRLTELLRGRLKEEALPAYTKLVSPTDLPIIFVTANGERYSEATLLSCGGDFIIPKPVDFVRLTVGLNSLLAARRATRAGA